MNDGLKKITFSMDKANGESRTVVMIGERISVGAISRLMFERPVTVHADETMTIKEEDFPHPGIVGTKGDVIIVDDFSLMETRVIQAINDLRPHQVMLVKQEKCWQQHRPYGKKARRGK